VPFRWVITLPFIQNALNTLRTCIHGDYNMAQLSSPGVSVTVVDESFYTPPAPGTVPLIIIASQANKMNSAGTGIAPGTLASNAGTVYLLTSQMDLGNTFGVPYFQTDAENNPVNAGELNEYGLQAAYSFLGVSSRAYVVRANLDTSQLIGTPTIPTGAPAGGTFWLNTSTTQFGVFEWNANPATATNGQTFIEQQSIGNLVVITNPAYVNNSTYAPLPSFGAQGDYAVVALTTLNKLWYKKGLTNTAAGTWVQVGTSAWIASRPTATGTIANPTLSATGTSFTGQISGTTLSVTGTVTGGPLAIGDVLSGTNLVAGTTAITAVNTSTFTATVSGTTLTVTGSPVGTITVGMVITGTSVTAGSYITALGTGTGGAGTYTLNQATTGTPTTGTSYTVNPTQTAASGTITTGGDTLTLNGTIFTGVTSVTALAAAINEVAPTGVTAAALNGYLNLYSNGTTTNSTTGAITLSGTIVAKVGLSSTTYLCPQFTASSHTSIPNYGSYTNANTANGAPTGSVWIKTTSVNLGSNWIIEQYNSSTSSWVTQNAPLYASNYAALAALDPTGGGINLSLDQLYVKYNDDEQTPQYADWKIYYRSGVGPTSVTSSVITATTFNASSYSFTAAASQIGSSTLPSASTVSFVATGSTADATTLMTALSAGISDPLVSFTLNANNSITITHIAGGDILFVDGLNTPLSKIFTPGTTGNWNYTAPKIDNASGASSTTYVMSNWASTVGTSGLGIATASATPPTTTPASGTLWYNDGIANFDIMINDGSLWRGYLTTQAKAINSAVYASGSQLYTDPAGPIVSASQPTTQAAGTPLANGDLWIDTATIGKFPQIFKYNSLTGKWVLINNTDHTTGNGIVFADARWSDQSSLATVQTGLGAPDAISTLLLSSFVDPDCISPALYPKGTLLFNLRRSDYNVKKYVTGYINTSTYNTQYSGTYPVGAGQLMTNYYPDRWVSDAANDTNGVGRFGAWAQRQVVVQALTATIESNQNIRQPDTVIFNLLSCPGYLEVASAMVGLNTDNGLSAFIVHDTPAHLTPDATTLSNWGNNTAGAAVDGYNGLIFTDAYSAIYYPWGYSQDLLGNDIVVPPSHIMLRTIALSDNVSYPWFAPAGVRRGGVTNASSVGYVDVNTGEFNTVALNQGQRDTLAGIHVNPITYLAGTGLVAYGQYTRQLVASSLDRINVARLVIYLRYQLNKIAKPYIFEPNDTITRNQIKQQIEAMLLELTAQRALYDFLVVCDTSNNTPARIDASELHVDIAIEPVKAVEFIYIPLRLENTGAIKGLGGK